MKDNNFVIAATRFFEKKHGFCESNLFPHGEYVNAISSVFMIFLGLVAFTKCPYQCISNVECKFFNDDSNWFGSTFYH